MNDLQRVVMQLQLAVMILLILVIAHLVSLIALWIKISQLK